MYRKGWHLLTDSNVVENACEELISRGWLKERITSPPQGQRGKTEYLINHLQGKAVRVQHLALDRMRAELSDDAIANALSPTAKTAYLNAATIEGGTAFDKERLERGESTQHISVLPGCSGGTGPHITQTPCSEANRCALVNRSKERARVKSEMNSN